jgi:hypothetical protein
MKGGDRRTEPAQRHYFHIKLGPDAKAKKLLSWCITLRWRCMRCPGRVTDGRRKRPVGGAALFRSTPRSGPALALWPTAVCTQEDSLRHNDRARKLDHLRIERRPRAGTEYS